MEGNIIVQKNDIDEDLIISNNSNTSSGSRRRSYRSRTRKEKQKKRHGSKISWWDYPVMNYINSEPNPNFPSHPDHIQADDPEDRIESRVRGVPIEIESEIKALLSDSDDVSTPEIVNNDFCLPFDTDGNATGTMIEEDGILYV